MNKQKKERPLELKVLLLCFATCLRVYAYDLWQKDQRICPKIVGKIATEIICYDINKKHLLFTSTLQVF